MNLYNISSMDFRVFFFFHIIILMMQFSYCIPGTGSTNITFSNINVLQLPLQYSFQEAAQISSLSILYLKIIKEGHLDHLCLHQALVLSQFKIAHLTAMLHLLEVSKMNYFKSNCAVQCNAMSLSAPSTVIISNCTFFNNSGSVRYSHKIKSDNLFLLWQRWEQSTSQIKLSITFKQQFQTQYFTSILPHLKEVLSQLLAALPFNLRLSQQEMDMVRLSQVCIRPI